MGEALRRATRPTSSWCRRLALHRAEPAQALLLGEWYSLAFNYWGVALQRSGRLPEARQRFEQALALNTNNSVARLNLESNSNLLAGVKMELGDPFAAARQIGDANRLANARKLHGPMDAPLPCYLYGSACAKAGLLRQAAQAFERTLELAPPALLAMSTLLEVYAQQGRYDAALAGIARLREELKDSPAADQVDLELSFFEARIWHLRANAPRAAAVLNAIAKKNPADELLVAKVAQSFIAARDYTNALAFNAARLSTAPDNVPLLVDRSGILLLMGRPVEAISPLNHVLTLTNSAMALLNRALANLQVGNLNAAETDYLNLTNAVVESGLATVAFQSHYGLAAIELTRGKTNAARQHLELCLSNALPNTPDWHIVSNKLDSPQSAVPAR